MLGLGDIVIPGIFVALVLRYDVRHARQTSFFNRCAPAGCVCGGLRCEEGQSRYCEEVHVRTFEGAGLHLETSRLFRLLDDPRSTFAGYVVGLATTIVVMNVFKAAQPALLYIVPALFLFTFSAAGASRGGGFWCWSWSGREGRWREAGCFDAGADSESPEAATRTKVSNYLLGGCCMRSAIDAWEDVLTHDVFTQKHGPI